MSQLPPSGFGFPNPPGIPSYPGTPALNSMPGLQYGPMFDGHNNHGLTSNPYDNSLFEDVNSFQDAIFAQNGLGYPPFVGGPTAPGASDPAAAGHGGATTDPAAGGHGTQPSAAQPTMNQHG
jgi:hypothetical protein